MAMILIITSQIKTSVRKGARYVRRPNAAIKLHTLFLIYTNNFKLSDTSFKNWYFKI